jgi:hypothetical protein
MRYRRENRPSGPAAVHEPTGCGAKRIANGTWCAESYGGAESGGLTGEDETSGAQRGRGAASKQTWSTGPPQNTRRLPKEPPRCCPGEGVRRSGLFCHAPRASITSAVPTTLTLPTHDLDAGAAWLTEQHRYPTRRGAVFQEFWHRELCKFLNLPVRRGSFQVAGPSPFAARPSYSSWIVTPVIATGSLGRSRPSRGADTIRSTMSRPLVTTPNNV